MTTRANFLHTFRDVIEHLVRWGGGLAPEGEENVARAAILAAYRKVFYDRKWKYFQDDQRLNLDAPYETGTIAYDFTGGTYERQLTLTDGTWPDWAAYGRVLLGSDTVIYKVLDRKSATVLTLDSTHSPRDDIDAADETTYTLFRSEYPLSNVHRFGPISDESGYWGGCHVSPETWLARERSWRTSGRPFRWTVMGGRDFYGSMGIRLTGYPDEAQTLDYIATVKPRRLVIDGLASAWNTGTVSAAAEATVVVDDNTFAREVYGAALRLSRNSDQPTDVEGGNPFLDQRIITAASSGTLTLDDEIALDGVDFGTGYCISDPVDLPEELYDLFLSWSEFEYARTSVPHKLVEAKVNLREARLMARAWDHRVEVPELAYPWAALDWLDGSITSLATYDGVPL